LYLYNGIPCTNTPKRRGLCDPCIWLIGRTEGYEYEQFTLPEKSKQHKIERKKKITKGVCLLIVDGIPCRKAVKARGICNLHYKLVNRKKKLAKFALTVEEAEYLPDIPHFYFDKNIIFRFAIHEILGLTPDWNSVALVQAVLDNKIRATVSLDCIRALYSHIGHRLSRPKSEGGREMDEKEAEKLAREYAGKLFFGREGLWHFMSFDEHQFDLCAFQGRLPNYSLEDALEVHLYAIAKEEYGATLFVTADGGILEYGEAVHPEKVARTYNLVKG